MATSEAAVAVPVFNFDRIEPSYAYIETFDLCSGTASIIAIN